MTFVDLVGAVCVCGRTVLLRLFVQVMVMVSGGGVHVRRISRLRDDSSEPTVTWEVLVSIHLIPGTKYYSFPGQFVRSSLVLRLYL